MCCAGVFKHCNGSSPFLRLKFAAGCWPCWRWENVPCFQISKQVAEMSQTASQPAWTDDSAWAQTIFRPASPIGGYLRYSGSLCRLQVHRFEIKACSFCAA